MPPPPPLLHMYSVTSLSPFASLNQTLLSPAGSSYQKLAEECVRFGVSVEIFLFPNSYCDVATLSGFVSSTGGEVHYFKNYRVCRLHV